MRSRPLLAFFVLANMLSWTVWAPLAASGLGWTTARLSPYLHLAGGLGPLVAALVVTASCAGRAGLARLIERCIKVRGRIGWIAFAILAPVLLFVVSAVLLNVAGHDQVDWANAGRSVEYPALSRAEYWLANIVFYGLGEEVGCGVLDIVMTSPVKGPLPLIMGAIITIWGLAIPLVHGTAELSRVPRVQDPAV